MTGIGVARTRFLSREEIGRLHRVLDRYAESGGERRKQADIVRLLLLTGLRNGEIVGLRWSEVGGGGSLELADGKMGPRRVRDGLNGRFSLRRSVAECDCRLGTQCDFPVDFHRGRPSIWASTCSV